MMLGTARSIAGTISPGYVDLGHYPDAPLTSAVMLATGQQDGPTLWLQAGIHGPEVVGQLAIARFLRGLDLSRLRGRIACLMVANPLGFRGDNRLTPQGGMNLNRVFPGNPEGTVSEQLAHRILELALATGDAMLDLHSGGDLTITRFYVIYHKGDGAAFANFTKRGKPALARNVRYGGNAVHLKTRRGGFWPTLATCGFERVGIGSIKRPFMPIYAGDQIIELVESVPPPPM
jgi:hypothetical protein